jgi:NAD(P)H-dependent flavin oxidoreductase YrpB (nitropropane dioxygenase family)
LGTLDGILSLYFEGDLDAAFAFGGQVAGRIDSVESVDDIIRSTMREFYATVDELARRYPAPR